MTNRSQSQTKEKVVIVGGGFAGMKCALELARKAPGKFHIVLINPTPHFEYHAALYRIVTGGNPLEVCIPLSEIFAGTDVEIVLDAATGVDLEAKTVSGSSGSTYSYDTVVLALGSQTDYYNTPGLAERAFCLKSTTDALRLKRHLHELLTSCGFNERHEQVCKAQFMVVGGGPTGTELAAELAVYMRRLAKRHGIDPSMITIDLIQSPKHLLPHLPEQVSEVIEERLRRLGVNLYFNRRILKSTAAHALVEGVSLKTSTVIWAAGVKGHDLYTQIKGLKIVGRGKVAVTPHLRAYGQRHAYIVGDGADTPHNGMAQTAFYDGTFVAQTIIAEATRQSTPVYKPVKPWSAVPIGPGWAAVSTDSFTVYGKLGWWLRRFIDLTVFLSILPLPKAISVFLDGHVLVESCPVCSELESTTGLKVG